jgi:hypothetical protein
MRRHRAAAHASARLLSNFNAAAIKVSSDGRGLAKLRRYTSHSSQGLEQ